MKSLIAGCYRLLPRAAVRALLWCVHPKFVISAAGLFLTSDGKVLVLRHVLRRTYPWGLPGGFVTPGEAPEQAALRELTEETGLAAVVDRILSAHLVAPRHLEVIVQGRVQPEQPLVLSREIFEARYVDPLDLPADMPPEHSRWISLVSRG
jgi:ADP-ribose pyrophosphatase YjhB (NUDIX family)